MNSEANAESGSQETLKINIKPLWIMETRLCRRLLKKDPLYNAQSSPIYVLPFTIMAFSIIFDPDLGQEVPAKNLY